MSFPLLFTLQLSAWCHFLKEPHSSRPNPQISGSHGATHKSLGLLVTDAVLHFFVFICIMLIFSPVYCKFCKARNRVCGPNYFGISSPLAQCLAHGNIQHIFADKFNALGWMPLTQGNWTRNSPAEPLLEMLAISKMCRLYGGVLLQARPTDLGFGDLSVELLSSCESKLTTSQNC